MQCAYYMCRCDVCMLFLLDSRAQVEAVRKNCAKCDHVQKRGDAMQFAELRVQGAHLLGVRRGIPASLAVLCLCISARVSKPLVRHIIFAIG